MPDSCQWRGQLGKFRPVFHSSSFFLASFGIIIVLLSPLVAILVTTGDCGRENVRPWGQPQNTASTDFGAPWRPVGVETCPDGYYYGDDDFAFMSASGYPSLVLDLWNFQDLP